VLLSLSSAETSLSSYYYYIIILLLLYKRCTHKQQQQQQQCSRCYINRGGCSVRGCFRKSARGLRQDLPEIYVLCTDAKERTSSFLEIPYASYTHAHTVNISSPIVVTFTIRTLYIHPKGLPTPAVR